MINRVYLVGNLTRDPQFFKTQSGISYARFTVASTRKLKDTEETAFINCLAWRGSADYITQYGKKGSMVVLEGHITTGSYDDKNTGKKIYTTDVTVEHVKLLNTASSNQSTSQSNSYTNTPVHEVNDDVDFDTGPLLDISSDDLPF